MSYAMQIQYVEVDKLYVSPTNPRKSFSEDEIKNLAKDILKNGLMHPPTLRLDNEGKYEIVVGSRRYRAYKWLNDNDNTGSYKVIPAFVRELTDTEVIEMQFSENLKREEVNPIEEAEAFELYLSKKMFTVTDLAEKLNHNVNYIYRRLKLNNLCDDAREILKKDGMPLSVAILVSQLAKNDQKTIIGQITTVREGKKLVYRTEDEVKRQIAYHILKLSDAPFDIQDKGLTGGACTQCPKNTGCDKLLFADMVSDARCTDKLCFDEKSNEYRDRELNKYQSENNNLVVFQSWETTPYIRKKYNLDESIELVELRNNNYEIVEADTEGAIPAFFIEASTYSSDNNNKHLVNKVIYLKKNEDTIDDDDDEQEDTALEIALYDYQKYLESKNTESLEKAKTMEISPSNLLFLRLIYKKLNIPSRYFDLIQHYKNEIHHKTPFKSKYVELQWRSDYERLASDKTDTVDEHIGNLYKAFYDKIEAHKENEYCQIWGVIANEFYNYVIKTLSADKLFEIIKNYLLNIMQGYGYSSEASLIRDTLIEAGYLEPLKEPDIEAHDYMPSLADIA